MNSQDLKEKIDQVFNKYLENPRENHELLPLIFILTQKSEEMEYKQLKFKESFEKFQFVMKQLKQSGAFETVANSITTYLMKKCDINEIKNPTPKIDWSKVQQQEQDQFDAKFKSAPLQTISNILGSSFHSKQNFELRKELGDLWDLFERLFNSSSETEARKNLIDLKNAIYKCDNAIKILKNVDTLEENQRYLIRKIMDFNLGEV